MSRLRIALLSYRSKPHCGGQGVYIRNLSRELAALGHDVTVFSGPPYPELDRVGEGVTFVPVPSLDLYREPDPFRIPHPREFRSWIDVLEFAGMLSMGFPEPLTFSLRAARLLRPDPSTGPGLDAFDVVHDNQSLGTGLLHIAGSGIPLVTTIHHPISRDRGTDLAAARGWRRVSLRRWYGFLRMQARVARAQKHIVTVSASSARDIARDFRVDPGRITVVPLGVDTDVFAPRAAPRVPGRIVAMASADTPLKGIDVLLRALAALRERGRRDAHLILVSRPTPGGTTERLIDRLGLRGAVDVVSDLPEEDLAALVASAEVACVPSRYEGFSLPTVEAMACGTPLVVSDAGALPEVVGGAEAGCAHIVPPGDTDALTAALRDVLGDPTARERMGRAARDRARTLYSWPAVAARTAEVYAAAIAASGRPRHRRTAEPGAPARDTRDRAEAGADGLTAAARAATAEDAA